jgi:hypothetical protein
LKRRPEKVNSALLRPGSIAALLAASALSLAGGIPVSDGESAALSPVDISRSRLCPSASPENESRPPLQNPTRKSLQDLLGIVPAAISIEYRSGDWQNAEAAADRAIEILHVRPRTLWPGIVWNEGADFRQRTLVASVVSADGSKVRLEVSGYQACMRDAAGRAWFFRAGPRRHLALSGRRPLRTRGI